MSQHHAHHAPSKSLLRDTNGDGIPELRTVFLDHFNSPFGVALALQYPQRPEKFAYQVECSQILLADASPRHSSFTP
jgi:hypothetical protein